MEKFKSSVCYYVVGFLCILLFYGEYIGLAEGVYGRDISVMHMHYYAYLSHGGPLGMLWNPFSHCGGPGLGNIALCMFYPFNLLAPLLEPLVMVRGYVLVHLLLFLWGLKLWLACFKLSFRLQILAVVLCLFSFPLRSILEYGHLTILTNWTFAPFVLWAMTQMVRCLKDIPEMSLKKMLLIPALPALSLLTVLLLLGGHPQMTLQLFVASVLWSLVYGLGVHRVFQVKAWCIFFTAIGLAVLLALVCTCFQWYETALSLSETGRQVSSKAEFFHLEGLLTPSIILKWLFPFIWGASPYWGQYDFWLGHMHLGFVGLAIAMCALMLRQKKQTYALLLVVIILLVLGMGQQTPVYAWYQSVVLPAKMFRLPFRFIYMASILLLPALMLVLQNARRRSVLDVAMAFILSLQLAFVVVHLHFAESLMSFYEAYLPEKVFGRLRAQGLVDGLFLWKWWCSEFFAICGLRLWLQKKGRFAGSPFFCTAGLCLLVFALAHALSLLPDSVAPEKYYKMKLSHLPQERVAIEGLRDHNFHLSYGLKSPAGYDSLLLHRYKEFLDTIIPQDWQKHTREQFYDFSAPGMENLGFSYILSGAEAVMQPVTSWTKRYSKGLYYGTTDFTWPGREASPYTKKIREKQQLLKREFEAMGYRFEASDIEGRVSEDRVTEGRVSEDHVNEARVNEEIGSYIIKAELLEWDIERVRLKIQCDRDVVLASSVNNFFLWKANCNGVDVPIYDWYGTFKAIPLHAGEHEVIYSIDRSGFIWRLAIGLGGVFLLLFYGLKVGLSHKTSC